MSAITLTLLYTIYGQRYNNIDPIIDSKTKEVIDDGTPKKIKLGYFYDKKVAEHFMEAVAVNVRKRTWKFWIEV